MGKMIRKMGFPQHVQQVMFWGKKRVWILREKGHIKCLVLFTGSTLKAQGLGCSESKFLGEYKFDLYYQCEKLGVVTFVYNLSTGGEGSQSPRACWSYWGELVRFRLRESLCLLKVRCRTTDGDRQRWSLTFTKTHMEHIWHICVTHTHDKMNCSKIY